MCPEFSKTHLLAFGISKIVREQGANCRGEEGGGTSRSLALVIPPTRTASDIPARDALFPRHWIDDQIHIS